MTELDLHIHTTYSDGRDAPKEIVSMAKENNVKLISIADHDMISGVQEAVIEGQKNGVKVVPGVEISFAFKNIPLHVLGYKIDISNFNLISFLDKNNSYRKDHFVDQISHLNSNLKKANKKQVDPSKYLNKPDKYYSIPGLALFLFEENIVLERSEGFNYLAGISDMAPSVGPKEAFDIIHDSKGIAIISHPFSPLVSIKEITNNQEIQEEILVSFKKQGLDGLECYCFGHSPEDLKKCLKLADKHNFLITAGSDWHGSLKQTGESIKKYIPYYPENFGDLEIPEKDVQKIIQIFES